MCEKMRYLDYDIVLIWFNIIVFGLVEFVFFIMVFFIGMWVLMYIWSVL